MAIGTNKISAGIVGLSAKGCRITACLLMAGHKVVAVSSIPHNMIFAESRIVEYFFEAQKAGPGLKVPEYYLKNLVITEDYTLLRSCRLVIECTAESLEIKKSIYSKIKSEIAIDALLISGTLVPEIYNLQKLISNPERFFGLHLLEPFYTIDSLKFIRGEKREIKRGSFLTWLSSLWGQEDSLSNTHIGRLISKQSIYTAYREHLIFLKSCHHPR